jgi:rod shape-determining protein MreC
LVIDKGSRNHIYVGQPIADARGVLGQVVQVTPYTSTVLLVSDERHAIAVELNRTGLRAVAVGTGQAEQLLLSFVPTNADVKVGDLVVSSGLDKRFPAGYPVGEVTEVSTEPGDPFAHIKVKPSAQIGHSREVLLVWPQRRATEAPDTP